LRERSITYDKAGRNPFDAVYVLLTNKSGVTQHLWEEWNSWGYHNLNFEVTDSTGRTWMIKRALRAWTMNGPTWFPLDPGETHVFAVTFPDDWEDLPKVDRLSDTYVTIRAIYEIPPDPMVEKNGVRTMDTTRKDNGVWIGKAISNPVKVRLLDAGPDDIKSDQK